MICLVTIFSTSPVIPKFSSPKTFSGKVGHSAIGTTKSQNLRVKGFSFFMNDPTFVQPQTHAREK